MHWNGLEDFLAMGGYGFYVWSSFGLTLVCMCIELFSLSRRGRAVSDEFDL